MTIKKSEFKSEKRICSFEIKNVLCNMRTRLKNNVHDNKDMRQVGQPKFVYKK